MSLPLPAAAGLSVAHDPVRTHGSRTQVTMAMELARLRALALSQLQGLQCTSWTQSSFGRELLCMVMKAASHWLKAEQLKDNL